MLYSICRSRLLPPPWATAALTFKPSPSLFSAWVAVNVTWTADEELVAKQGKPDGGQGAKRGRQQTTRVIYFHIQFGHRHCPHHYISLHMFFYDRHLPFSTFPPPYCIIGSLPLYLSISRQCWWFWCFRFLPLPLLVSLSVSLSPLFDLILCLCLK